MSDKENDSDVEEKTTNEKPISLDPLDFKEALADLLAVKPKQEAER